MTDKKHCDAFYYILEIIDLTKYALFSFMRNITSLNWNGDLLSQEVVTS